MKLPMGTHLRPKEGPDALEGREEIWKGIKLVLDDMR